MYKSSIVNPRCQRGAIGMWGALTLLLSVIFTALAVDTGRLWMQQRKLQAIADIASMRAAQQLGCAPSIADALTAAQTAAVQNGYSGSLSAAPNTVELGSVNTVGGIRQFTTGGIDAVRVIATQSVPASLVAGGLFSGQTVLSAQAVSLRDPPQAAFSAGSSVLSINPDDATLLNGLLGHLLGAPLSLDVASYQGLASAKVTLRDLARAHGAVNSINDLLATNMPLKDLLDLIAAAANASGTVDSATVTTLQQLAASANSNHGISLNQVLDISNPNGSDEVGINVLSLINAAGMAANSQHVISLPIAVTLPGASANAAINILQPPKNNIGPAPCTTVRTAQIQISITASVLSTVSLTLNVSTGQGEATLTSLSDDGTQAEAVIDALPGIASLNGTARVLSINAIGINLPIQPGTAQQLNFTVPHPVAEHLPQTAPVSSPVGASLANALSQPNVLSIPALGLSSGVVTPLITGTLSPLLGQIG
ncbi:MAG TPA: TadG family pilus assembly protein, partial [Methylophilaceae bacterium]|nr:TadG family pilus assembly protein [Methylophilaceae bacterium]